MAEASRLVAERVGAALASAEQQEPKHREQGSRHHDPFRQRDPANRKDGEEGHRSNAQGGLTPDRRRADPEWCNERRDRESEEELPHILMRPRKGPGPVAGCW